MGKGSLFLIAHACHRPIAASSTPSDPTLLQPLSAHCRRTPNHTCAAPTQQTVALLEAVVSACPPCPPLLQLLLDQQHSHPSDLGWAEWLLPLCATAACGAGPEAAAAGDCGSSTGGTVSAASWGALVRLARRVSSAVAARSLARRATQAQPWDMGLRHLVAQVGGAAAAAAGG